MPLNNSTSYEQILEEALGVRNNNLPVAVTLTIVYVIIFVTGVVGNVSTCIVIAKNTYMHTVTNYYLLSLAVSDMLTLCLGLPPEVYCIWEAYPWRFGEAFCIFKAFLAEMTSYSSVLTITAFTIERYIAICHPIKSQTLSNLSRAVKIIVGIWIVAAAFSIPYPIYTRTYYYVFVNETPVTESLICNISPEWRPAMIHVFQMSTFVFFILPMSMISIMYILIGRTLSKSHFNANTGNSTPTKHRARKSVVKMLIAVVIAFFCCWAPFNAQRLMTSYIPPQKWTPELIAAQTKLFYVSGVLFFFSSTVNPILYNIMSKKFQMAFRRTLCRCCYAVDELIELSSRTKSMYFCSERSPYLSRRATSNTSLAPAAVDMRRSYSGSVLSVNQYGSTVSLSNRLMISRCLHGTHEGGKHSHLSLNYFPSQHTAGKHEVLGSCHDLRTESFPMNSMEDVKFPEGQGDGAGRPEFTCGSQTVLFKPHFSKTEQDNCGTFV